jgi:hypothetical protein
MLISKAWGKKILIGLLKLQRIMPLKLPNKALPQPITFHGANTLEKV